MWGPNFVNSAVSDYKVLTIQVGALPAFNFLIQSQMMLAIIAVMLTYLDVIIINKI